LARPHPLIILNNNNNAEGFTGFFEERLKATRGVLGRQAQAGAPHSLR
jgi:hypothetical protein